MALILPKAQGPRRITFGPNARLLSVHYGHLGIPLEDRDSKWVKVACKMPKSVVKLPGNQYTVA